MVDRALVAVDRFHHSLENRVEKLACLFRVAIRQELHRAPQIREEHRDLLALAFQRASRAENLLSQILRRVRLRGTELRLVGPRGQRAAAAAAKLLVALVGETAERARRRQR